MAVCQLDAQLLAVRVFRQQGRQQARLPAPGFRRPGRLTERVVNIGDLIEKPRGVAAHRRVICVVWKQPLVEVECLLQHSLPGAVGLPPSKQGVPQFLEPADAIQDDA